MCLFLLANALFLVWIKAYGEKVTLPSHHSMILRVLASGHLYEDYSGGFSFLPNRKQNSFASVKWDLAKSCESFVRLRWTRVLVVAPWKLTLPHVCIGNISFLKFSRALLQHSHTHLIQWFVYGKTFSGGPLFEVHVCKQINNLQPLKLMLATDRDLSCMCSIWSTHSTSFTSRLIIFSAKNSFWY